MNGKDVLGERNKMPRSEDQPHEISKCLCNEPIYAGDPLPRYTCDEAPCYPMDGEMEEDDDN